ncbi:MAG: amino acid permease [Lachnospiraceae bacterium]|jgi:APA family basic amino acid/polyamine antiporter|nr:amino acid permease [Lachnospiraceae bacterium]MEE3462105.1 amino acid permease [Lachnospiraceae bacterium]
MKLIYVYAMATGAIFTFMCYWDGIFMSYTGPATFLAFALMTLMVLPTAFVYAEFSTMLPSTGSCLVFNTIGINKHAGFWSAWLIMCSWVAVPAAGVLGILQWINYQFGVNLHGPGFVLAGILMLIAWCLLSLYKNVVAGRVQSFMLFAGIGRATWMGFIGYMGVGLILWLYMVLFRWKHDKVWMKTPDGKMEF